MLHYFFIRSEKTNPNQLFFHKQTAAKVVRFFNTSKYFEHFFNKLYEILQKIQSKYTTIENQLFTNYITLKLFGK